MFGAGELAYVLGLFHDAGKASCVWQDRLLEVEGTDNPVGVPHKELGARLTTKAVGFAALAILGHHGGLKNRGALDDLDLDGDWSAADVDAAVRFLTAVPEGSGARLASGLYPSRWRSVKDKLGMEMRLRMVFSAMVDADHLDTAAHRRGLAAPHLTAPVDMRVLAARFEQRRAEKVVGPVTDVGRMRSEVYQAAVDAAAKRPGLFRLAAPTGLGKTYAQAGFGLEHAARHGKSRVIVAVPFITITEQNAGVYRELLDTDEQPVVLEQHSSVRFGGDDDRAVTDAERWARLAAENWDAPFVVTTTVQLFESLFGRKPSQVRKLHRLADAVVILDEVQALPTRLLLPILSGLRTLVEDFGTTVLLTSATQPEFQALSVWKPSAERAGVSVTEVIEDPQPLFERARRVDYEWRLEPQLSWDQVADGLAGVRQAMVIVNSVADARNLYRLLSVQREEVWHLSTRMCPQHRRQVLAVVKSRLTAGLPTLLVSTQLIEAGVDVSFPVVWRALAPADSLQQAGGRANRNGELREGGLVVVFDPQDGKRPAEYERACALTVKYFGPHGAKLDDQAMLASYYRELYEDLQLDYRRADRSKDNVGQIVQANREDLDYFAVADGPLDIATGARNRKKAFRMILDESVPVVVPDAEHEATLEALLADLAAGTTSAGAALRMLQPWIVQLGERTASAPSVSALISPVVGDLGRWNGIYDWDPNTCRGVGLDENEIDLVI